MLAISSDGLLVKWTFFYSIRLTLLKSQFPVGLKYYVTFFFKTLSSHFLYKDSKKGDKNEYK